MLYAEQLVKIHFLIQEVCSLNREGMGGGKQPSDLYILNSAGWSSTEASSEWQSYVPYTGPCSIQALTELCHTSKIDIPMKIGRRADSRSKKI